VVIHSSAIRLWSDEQEDDSPLHSPAGATRTTTPSSKCKNRRDDRSWMAGGLKDDKDDGEWMTMNDPILTWRFSINRVLLQNVRERERWSENRTIGVD
jgi:hypothetical protein